jgi:sensor histidine kinase YesM
VTINVLKAANLFFPNPSLEVVYFKAVANSIDADATNIWINIKIGDFNLEISDNGDGFKESNFNKFSSLLEVDEETHKGVGRLVFLHYFSKIEITSFFENKLRKFVFSGSFNGDSDLSDNK